MELSTASRAAQAQKGFGELMQALRSPDRRSRRGAQIFILSVLGMLAVGVGTIVHLRHLAQERTRIARLRAAREQAELARRSAEHPKLVKTVHFSLGDFTVDLVQLHDANTDGRQPASNGILHLEISAECESPELCKYIETHLEKA